MSSDSYLVGARTDMEFLKTGDFLIGMKTRCLFRKKQKKALTANQTTNFEICYTKDIIIICVWELSWAADSYLLGQEYVDSMEPWYSLPCVTKLYGSICPNLEECSLYLRICLKINIIVALPTRLMSVNLHLPKFVYRFLLSPLLMLSLTLSLFLIQSHLKYL
jgi:hypothetical protein